MIGKVDPDRLIELILDRTGHDDPAVEVGSSYGEDAAAIAFGNQYLVVSSDPLSLAASDLGRLAVYVASNDVAASGADPRWLTAVLFLPTDDPSILDKITSDMDQTAATIDLAIVGGHTEILPILDRPLVSLTCIGTADRFISSGGATAGDRIVLTKGAAIEGTAIIANDFANRLPESSPAEVTRARAFVDEIGVIREAAILRSHATAMHDPTEGGVLAGLIELALASEVELVVERSSIPVRPETTSLCAQLSLDPLRIFGSGALLASLPAMSVSAALDELESAGIDAAVIGHVEASDDPGVRLDGTLTQRAPRDELYPLWE